MKEQYYSRVLIHGSKYGGFITKNGRKNNSSEYNRNYYLANIFKWKNKEKDDEESSQGKVVDTKNGLVATKYLSRKANNYKSNLNKYASGAYVNGAPTSDIYRSVMRGAYNNAANRVARAKTKKEKKQAMADLAEEKQYYRAADYGARKQQMAKEKTAAGKKEQAAKDKKTKAAREKHLAKDYVDMTSNKKRTMQQIVRGDKFLEKHSDALFSSSVKYTDSSGRVTELKNVGKAERAARNAKKKVDKFLNSLGRKKKKKNNIKVSHQTSITSQPRLVSKKKK